MPNVSVETIGEAYDRGWRISARCALGKRETMKSVRECHQSVSLDLETLVWTRGRDFPLDRLASRLKCPRCGSREVRLLFDVTNLPTPRVGRLGP